jgi:hypothetical protein
VRRGTLFEDEDRERNAELANQIILGCSGYADDMAIALDMMGWKIVPINGDSTTKWPMAERHPLNPPWADDDPAPK